MLFLPLSMCVHIVASLYLRSPLELQSAVIALQLHLVPEKTHHDTLQWAEP